MTSWLDDGFRMRGGRLYGLRLRGQVNVDQPRRCFARVQAVALPWPRPPSRHLRLVFGISSVRAPLLPETCRRFARYGAHGERASLTGLFSIRMHRDW